MVKST